MDVQSTSDEHRLEVPDVVINHHGNVKALIRFASSDIWFTAFKGVRDLTKMQSEASLDKVLDQGFRFAKTQNRRSWRKTLKKFSNSYVAFSVRSPLLLASGGSIEGEYPCADVVKEPVHAVQQILTGDGAAPNNLPVVGLDFIQFKNFLDLFRR